ncbi:MAG TPA: CopD family protein [Streptosporangiaceae bacterium]
MTSAAGVRLGGRSAGQRRALAYAIVIADAGVAALLFGLWLGGGWPADQILALASAGPFTEWSLPVVRLAVQGCAVGTVGMLITSVLLPRTDGELTDTALRCLRTASWLAVGWGAGTAALLALTWSDDIALPVTKLPFSQLLGGPGATASFPEAIPYLFGALLSLLIAAGAGMAQTTQGAIGLLVLSGYNLLPLSTQGHATHSPITPYVVTVHVIAVSLWVGGLAGMLVHVRADPDVLAVAVPRFSTLALICYVAVGASGLTAGLVLAGSPAELWSSRYGALVLCKVAALGALGYFGWRHRRRTVPALAAGRTGAARAFLRLAAAEVVVMAATIALGVALSQNPTPGTSTGGGTGGGHEHAAPAGRHAGHPDSLAGVGGVGGEQASGAA